MDHTPRMVKARVVWGYCTAIECKCEAFKDPDDPYEQVAMATA